MSSFHDVSQRQGADLDGDDFRVSLRCMAIDLVESDQRRTFKTDVWAFGMTVYVS